jgi:carboxyl-terminal processing protease
MKRIIPIVFFTFLVLLIGLSYTLNPTVRNILQERAGSAVYFPWDPLEWDTLRDMPLGYRSLGEESDSTPVYKPYLKDPSKLGFTPDNAYFNTVLSHIKENSVKNITDAELMLGIEKELKKLFKDADVNEEPSIADEKLDRQFMERLRKKYESKVPGEFLIFAGIRGLLRGLHDPYTAVLKPKDYNMLLERLQQKSFGGIGVYIELDAENDKKLTIIEPIEGTPAAKAGIHGGDVIEKIQNESTKDITIDMAVAKLRGEKGSKVKLSIGRKGVDHLLDFNVERDNINVPSVSYKVLEGNVGYVRIRMFGTGTEQELIDAITAMKGGIVQPESPAITGSPDGSSTARGSNPITSLIVDLRNNGGGYLNAAVDVSSLFITPDKTVFKRLDKKGVITDFKAKKTMMAELPMVLLVNRFSASSSEIVAGAIKDNRAGTLIGDRTFGKGSVQQIYPLEHKSALKLTVSYFLTPKGRIINRKGLKPDIMVPMKANLVGRQKDVQLRQAIEFLKKNQEIHDAAR